MGIVLALTVLVALAASSTIPASADPPNGPVFGPPQLLADNNIHTFHHSPDLQPYLVDAIGWVQHHALDQPTSMTTTYLEGYSSNVDVHSFNQDYKTWDDACWDSPCPAGQSQTGIVARAKCESTEGTADPQYFCQRWSVRYDLDDVSTYTDRQRRAVACHEIGHTLGFQDYHEGEMMNPDDCMVKYVPPDEAAAECWYVHQLHHVNAQYPTPPGQTQYWTVSESECSPAVNPNPPQVCCNWGGGGGDDDGGSGGSTYRETCDTVENLGNGQFVMGAPGSELAASSVLGLQNCG